MTPGFWIYYLIAAIVWKQRSPIKTAQFKVRGFFFLFSTWYDEEETHEVFVCFNIPILLVSSHNVSGKACYDTIGGEKLLTERKGPYEPTPHLIKNFSSLNYFFLCFTKIYFHYVLYWNCGNCSERSTWVSPTWKRKWTVEMNILIPTYQNGNSSMNTYSKRADKTWLIPSI